VSPWIAPSSSATRSTKSSRLRHPPFRLREHLDRLHRSLSAIRMAAPKTHVQWGEICRETREAKRRRNDQYLYLQVTRGAELGRNHAWRRASRHDLRLCQPVGSALARTARGRGRRDHLSDTRWARRDIKSTALLANVLLKNSPRMPALSRPSCWNAASSRKGHRPRCTSSHGARYTPRPTGIRFFRARPRCGRRAGGAGGHRQPQCAGDGESSCGASEIWLAFSTRGVLPVTVWTALPWATAGPARCSGGCTRLFSITSANSLEPRTCEHGQAGAFSRRVPIKVMGRQDSDLRAATREIIERHTGPLEDARIRVRTRATGIFWRSPTPSWRPDGISSTPSIVS